jgi:hypothetical protein
MLAHAAGSVRRVRAGARAAAPVQGVRLRYLKHMPPGLA